MNRRLGFHRLADREMNEAAQYYELQRPGLGEAFLDEVVRGLRRIAAHPEAGVILVGSVRRRLLRRFPYALLYKIKPDHIPYPSTGRDEPQATSDLLDRP